MKTINLLRAITATVMAGAVSSAVAAYAQITRVPAPALANPNRPQADWHPAPDERFSALEFIVKTGDDDLRGDSGAWVTITFPDHSSQKCDLKLRDQDGWGNNSTHTNSPQCILSSPKTFADLKGSEIVLFYEGESSSGWESQDNWDIKEVLVRAQDFSNKKYPCLIHAQGSPLVRLKRKFPETYIVYAKGDFYDDAFDLSQTPNMC